MLVPGVKEVRARRLGIRERSVSQLGPARAASWGGAPSPCEGRSCGTPAPPPTPSGSGGEKRAHSRSTGRQKPAGLTGGLGVRCQREGSRPQGFGLEHLVNGSTMDRHGQAAVRAGLGVRVSERTEPASSAEGAGLVQKALCVLPSALISCSAEPPREKGGSRSAVQGLGPGSAKGADSPAPGRWGAHPPLMDSKGRPRKAKDGDPRSLTGKAGGLQGSYMVVWRLLVTG